MACFPNGSLRWQEIAKPENAELISRLDGLLLPDATEGKAVGKLMAIKASLCTPWLDVGEADSKSNLKITVKWTFHRANGILVDEVVETEVSRKKYDIRFDSALISEALEASLKEALEIDRK
jgi:hypothetical protein